MRTTITATGLAAALSLSAVTHAPPVAAQGTAPRLPAAVYGRGLELRPYAGGFVPTGTQRDLLKDAVLVGAQGGWHYHPNFAVTGSLGWAPSRDKSTAFASGPFRTGREEKVDLWQYDVGIEGRLPITTAASWVVTPYVGIGAGGRTYSYRDLDDTDAETNVLGYGALGLDVAPASGPVGIRLQVRDNISAFKGLRGEYREREARNDVQVSAGLTWRF